jgi:hypothetical protein
MEVIIMKKTNVFASFNTGVFISSFICFMIFINLLFFIQGTFFSDGGYIFDVNKYVFEELPVAFLCSVCAAFVKKREK